MIRPWAPRNESGMQVRQKGPQFENRRRGRNDWLSAPSTMHQLRVMRQQLKLKSLIWTMMQLKLTRQPKPKWLSRDLASVERTKGNHAMHVPSAEDPTGINTAKGRENPLRRSQQLVKSGNSGDIEKQSEARWFVSSVQIPRGYKRDNHRGRFCGYMRERSSL